MMPEPLYLHSNGLVDLPSLLAANLSSFGCPFLLQVGNKKNYLNDLVVLCKEQGRRSHISRNYDLHRFTEQVCVFFITSDLFDTITVCSLNMTLSFN